MFTVVRRQEAAWVFVTGQAPEATRTAVTSQALNEREMQAPTRGR
jgi:hypothetical protein